MSAAVDVLAWLDAKVQREAEIERATGLPNDAKELAISVHNAVAKLIEANRRTIEAFEALGRAQGVAANHFARRECEVAMVAQKAAIANASGAK